MGGCLCTTQNGVVICAKRRISLMYPPPSPAVIPIPRELSYYHLIVDDGIFNILIMRRFLEQRGVTLDEVHSGEDCLQNILQSDDDSEELTAKKKNYGIIWMDVGLKVGYMTGIECTRKLRAAGYEGVIIAVTGYVDETTYRACMNAGMTHFLGKPFARQAVSDFTELYGG